MHLPATALPGAPLLLADPVGQAVAAQVFGRRSVSQWPIGPLLVAGGDLVVAEGRGVQVDTGGPSARMGTATLVAGTVTVNTAAVTAASVILLTGQDASGAPGELTISARTPGTSFDITSTSATDTRLIGWLILEPAA